MKRLRALKLWMVENHLYKRGYRRLQHAQMEEHRSLVAEIKDRRSQTVHQLADAVLQLDAVSDRLEQSLEDLSREQQTDG